MFPAQDPTAEEILEGHRPLLGRLIEAVRAGTLHVQEYSDWQDEPVDRTLAPSLVRKGAKRLLLAHNEDNLEIKEDDFKTEHQPNLGILVVASNGDRFRVLKSDQDSLPVPGDSRQRQAYYAQQGELFPVVDDDEKTGPRLNYILHWTADDEYNLNRVYLACPKKGGKTRESVEVYFDELIWSKARPFSSEQAEAHGDDLDLYIEGSKTGTRDDVE